MQDFYMVAAVPALMLGFVSGLAIFVHFKERLYFLFLSFLLLGYYMGGKGFAYVGVRPLYVSEVALALGCATVLVLVLLRGRLYVGAVKHWPALVLTLFMLWGAARTLPFIPEYGLEALRDGVIWGYAIFAFCAALLLTPQHLEKLFGIYGRLLPALLLWLVIIEIGKHFVVIPSFPGAPVPIINLKSGDAGVHLAGAAAFLLMRLDRVYGKPYPTWLIWVMWALWGMAWILYGSVGRSGMLSALIGVAVAFWFRPTLTGWVRPAVLVSLLLAGLLLADLVGLTQRDEEVRRQLSFEQISTNFTSLVGGPSRADQDGTMRWRLDWWAKIVDYTFGGDYLWDGKGFGVNLTISDEINNTPREGQALNRHPHNITMNILARAGLPGLVLWLAFLASFGLRLLGATRRHSFGGKTAVWLLAYWLAFLFNAQTDVFLEGPMGGVWFWSLTGIIWVFLYRMPKWYAQSLPVPHAAFPVAPHSAQVT